MKIYAAVHAAITEIATEGVGKSRRNKEQNYDYRGVEDAMNAVSPLLVKHKIVVIPRFTEHSDEMRETKSGGKMKYVKVKGVFKFVHAEDASSFESEIYGEGMDVADKATTKAESVAYRICLFQTFCIPYMGVLVDPEGDNGGVDEEAEMEALLQGHIKEASLLREDKSVLDYWKKERVAFANDKARYDRFTAAVAAHRKTLAARQPAGATQ